MALPTTKHQMTSRTSEIHKEPNEDGTNQSNKILPTAKIVKRAVEWGLVKSEGGVPNIPTVSLSSSEQGVKQSSERIIESTRSSESNESNKPADSSFPMVSPELKDALSTLQQTFVVSDTTRPGYLIMYMYASTGFFGMTGYSLEKVIGRNCCFLQGPGTDKIELTKIREAIKTGKATVAGS